MNNDHHKPNARTDQESRSPSPSCRRWLVGFWISMDCGALRVFRAATTKNKLRFDVVHNGRLYIF
jgi:hypothetical protein